MAPPKTSRQVIHLGVGQCGIQMSKEIWRVYCIEHDIDPTNGHTKDGMELEDDSFLTFYRQSDTGKYTPRALMIDLEPTVCDQLRNSDFKNLFAPEKIINGSEDAANVIARGLFIAGKLVIPEVLEVLRREQEMCDAMHGLFFANASGGGTGSGFSAKILEDFLPDKRHYTTLNLVVQPSKTLAVSTVEHYNAMHYLNHTACKGAFDFIVNLDNEAMYRHIPHHLGPTYWHMNQMVSYVSSALTSNLRFASKLNVDFAGMKTNLVPFPQLFMLSVAANPLNTYDMRRKTDDITYEVFRSDVDLMSIDPRQGQYISVMLQYRGVNSMGSVNQSIQEIKKEIEFVPWMPTGFKICTNLQNIRGVSKPDGGIFDACDRTVCKVANTTAILDFFKSVYGKFETLADSRAFVSFYLQAGMEEGEFTDCVEQMQSIVDAYKAASGKTTGEEE